MRTVVIGIGSIGTVLGACAAAKGFDIELMDADQANVEALNQNGATVVGELELNVPVKAILPHQLSGKYDLAILTTKQTANTLVLNNLLSYLNEDSVVCTLQNGIPEEFVASYVGADRTAGGVVGFGATWLKPGVSQLTTALATTREYAFDIGPYGNIAEEKMDAIAEILGSVGNTPVISNLMDVRWSKLLMNTTFSGMSTAMGVGFHGVLFDDKALECIAHIADETIKVCHAMGYKMIFMQGLDFERLELQPGETLADKKDMYLQVWTKHNIKASMLQDLEKGRKTEIDYINGIVSTFGRKFGILTPFNDMVVQLVKEEQESGQLNDMSSLSRFDELLRNARQ